MIDIGPRLDSRLRGKFDRIEAEAPPERLMGFQPRAARRRHRLLNAVVGVAAVAVVAGAATVFALELAGHARPAPAPAPASAPGGPLPKMPVFSPQPDPNVYKDLPLPAYDTGFPTSWYIVVPLTKHSGSAVLPAFIPSGWEYIQYACVGPGHLQLETPDGVVNESLKPCSSSTKPVDAQISGASGPLHGAPVALTVVASPSVRWEMVVAVTAPPTKLPTLPALPAGAQVLVPLTYGNGIAALPSFTPHANLMMEWWCSGPGGILVFVSNGNESQGASNCGVSGSGGSDDYTGKRETLVVDVSPANQWEIIVYWQPDQSG
jgi:hypothetical protein